LESLKKSRTKRKNKLADIGLELGCTEFAKNNEEQQSSKRGLELRAEEV
jgi:hypothetical protein